MNKIATIAKLQKIPCKDNGERLIRLEKGDYRRTDSGVESVLIRETVFNKLQNVQKQLPSDTELLVVEGYRPSVTQEKYYLKEFAALLKANPYLELELLVEKTHQFIALPTVAGHPTGGAVDLSLMVQGKEVDMGGAIADFRLPHLLPTYSTFITVEQSKWRKILLDLMLKEGFAPFYGEWWHFSYGDREWAAFYDQKETLYGQLHYLF